jgi:hypothetical protein
MKSFRIAALVALALGSVWLTAFVALNVLPSGWADQMDTFWWTTPTVVTLYIWQIGVVIMAAAGVFHVIEDGKGGAE